MLFNSLEYAFFLPTIFVLYWFLVNKKLKLQNLLLLFSSYFFYALWDWRFLFLLVFSTLLDFYTGLKIEKSPSKTNRKIWFWISVSVNLGFLCTFKYFNFFTTSFTDFISLFGLQINPYTINIILPVGISFYTFHGLSYVIDIYKQKINAEKNFIDYGLFVSFFPLLVAGPIERATHLLPQIKKTRQFDYNKAIDGLRQILWGLFKKIVIADNCAFYVNQIFESNETLSGSTYLIGAILFAFQIYGDFSGYSDIALGTARLFGIELLRNFAFPYFSRDIAEFWRRWHISLTTWFRDYVYIPLGGSKGGKWVTVRNTFIIFLVSGFWHGANWTFIAWGIFHAVIFLPLLLLQKNRKNTNSISSKKILPNLKEFTQITFTFLLVVIGWIFFRAKNLEFAFNYLASIFNKSLFTSPKIEGANGLYFCLIIMLLIEWKQRNKNHGLEITTTKFNLINWLFYIIILLLILFFGGKSETFIYFQF